MDETTQAKTVIEERHAAAAGDGNLLKVLELAVDAMLLPEQITHPVVSDLLQADEAVPEKS